MLRAICIGGPRDGETIETPDGVDYFVAPVTTEARFMGGRTPPPEPQIMRHVRYRLRDAGWGSPGKVFYFWVPEEQNQDETLAKLFAGYRPPNPNLVLPSDQLEGDPSCSTTSSSSIVPAQCLASGLKP